MFIIINYHHYTQQKSLNQAAMQQIYVLYSTHMTHLYFNLHNSMTNVLWVLLKMY